MNSIERDEFHRLLGERKPRMTYRAQDFLDYTLMCAVTAGVILWCYEGTILAVAGVLLCVYMVAAFLFRHGAKLAIPLLLRRPQDVLFMLFYKTRNVKSVYFVALTLLVLENYLIAQTPQWPHQVDLMRTLAFWAFWLHLGGITVYRTVVLVDHLRKRHLVREILLQSSWRSFLARQPNVTVEIVHAYCTGLLTHIALIAPWYVVISYASFSLLLVPVTVVAGLLIQRHFLNQINRWFYRDHWLGHNSELEFVYLHGPHHDAIPSGLIGVAGNGFLEGVLRNVIAYPTPFLNPIAACVLYSVEVHRDIIFHQFIPGVFPILPRAFREICQHSTHHFGRLEPYGFAIKLDVPGVSADLRNAFAKLPQEFTNSVVLDEHLNDFQWDNPRYRWFLAMCDKYDKR